MLNRISQTLALSSILSLVIFYTLLHFNGEVTAFNSLCYVISSALGLALTLYFLKDTKRSLLWFIILFFSGIWISDLFKIFYFPAADILLVFGYLIYFPLLAITFLALGMQKQKPLKVYLLITGVLLVCQILIPILLEPWDHNFPQMIVNYLLAAVSFTAVMKNQMCQSAEAKLMALLLLYSILNIIHGIFT